MVGLGGSFLVSILNSNTATVATAHPSRSKQVLGAVEPPAMAGNAGLELFPDASGSSKNGESSLSREAILRKQLLARRRANTNNGSASGTSPVRDQNASLLADEGRSDGSDGTARRGELRIRDAARGSPGRGAGRSLADRIGGSRAEFDDDLYGSRRARYDEADRSPSRTPPYRLADETRRIRQSSPGAVDNGRKGSTRSLSPESSRRHDDRGGLDGGHRPSVHRSPRRSPSPFRPGDGDHRAYTSIRYALPPRPTAPTFIPPHQSTGALDMPPDRSAPSGSVPHGGTARKVDRPPHMDRLERDRERDYGYNNRRDLRHDRNDRSAYRNGDGSRDGQRWERTPHAMREDRERPSGPGSDSRYNGGRGQGNRDGNLNGNGNGSGYARTPAIGQYGSSGRDNGYGQPVQPQRIGFDAPRHFGGNRGRHGPIDFEQ